MRPTPFNDLSISDKMLLIEDMAIHLCSIEHYDHRIHLYSLNNLFIEVYHNIETKQIEKIEIAEYSALDKFLSRVMIYQHS